MNILNTILLFMCLVSLGHSQVKIDSLKTYLKNDPNNIEAMAELGVAYHDLGVAGDKNAVESGEKIFNQILEQDSSHAVSLAYLGSIYSLKARDAAMPWNKMKHAKKGIELLDHPAVVHSDDVQVHLIRAMNSYQVPKFMNRLKIALDEFDFIIKHAAFDQWQSQNKAFVYLHYGKALEKAGNEPQAKENYQRAFELAPFSESGKEAGEALKK